MKPFCIYFPQFYPTEINNKSWGIGFTDWTLVSYANMRNLWARRAPKRGFYNGSDVDVHINQLLEMKQFGLGGVAVYHYWFYHRTELDAFEKTLSNKNANKDFPWFLIWAAENWSKRWLQDKSEIITISKDPTESDIYNHCLYLAGLFENNTYFKIDGRPLFVIYNLSHFSNPNELISKYRDAFNRLGQNPLIGQFVKSTQDIEHSHILDFNYMFEPRLFFGFNSITRGYVAKKIYSFLNQYFGEGLTKSLLVFTDKLKKKRMKHSASSFLIYLRSAERKSFLESFQSPTQEIVSPGWNNVPRHGDYFTALEDMPHDEFSIILREASKKNNIPPLINAWNEWSEGAAIEPCEYYGSAYLEAVKNLQE